MKNILILVLTAVLLFGCSKNDVLIDNGMLTPLSVSSASLSAVVTRDAPAAIATGSIGLFLQENTAYGYAALNDVEYANTNNSGWIAKSTIIYLNSNPATVCAYYPLAAAGINANTNPANVTLTSKLYAAGEDLCYVANNVTKLNNTAPSVSFTMSHAYSQITFNITKDVTYTGLAAIGPITISNAGIKISNTLDITTGTYGTGTAGSVTYDPAITSITTGTPASTSVLMVPVPTAMTGDVVLSFTVDGNVLSTTLPTSSLATLAAGSNYSIAVLLKGAALLITSVTATNWLPVPVSGGVILQ